MENKGENRRSGAARGTRTPSPLASSLPILKILQNIVLQTPVRNSEGDAVVNYGEANVRPPVFPEEFHAAVDNRDANGVDVLQLPYHGHQQGVDNPILGDLEFPELQLSDNFMDAGAEIDRLVNQYWLDDAQGTALQATASETNNTNETAAFNAEHGVESAEPLSNLPSSSVPSISTPSEDGSDKIETRPRRFSILSLKSSDEQKASQSGADLKDNGGSNKRARTDRREIEELPSTSGASDSVKAPPKKRSSASLLKQLLSRESSSPVFNEEAGPSKKGKMPVGKRQVKKGSRAAKNVRPIDDNVATKAGCSGATLPTRVADPTPIVNQSDSGSESEFDIFSQTEDRELFKKCKKRCRQFDKEYEALNTDIQSAENEIQREEEHLRNAEENIRRLQEELRRFEEERHRAEETIEDIKNKIKKKNSALNEVEKRRALIRKRLFR